MNRDEARLILESARPGGRDEASPEVAEALRLMAADPELARLWAAQQTFDATMAEGARSIPVPMGLRDAILAERKIVRPHFWQNWRTASAAAAAIVLLLGGGYWAIQKDSENFVEFRRELIADRGSIYARLDFQSKDPSKVRTYLAEAGAPANFEIPAGLKDWELKGGSVFRLNGQTVGMIGLADGLRRLNLFVFQGAEFSDLPNPGALDFENCGGWRTASWRQGDTTFVLTGLKLQAVMSKFRKSGRWTILDRNDGAVFPLADPAAG